MWICADSPPTGIGRLLAERLDLLLGAVKGTSGMLVRVSNGGGRSSLAG
jgi:hypothetical protein